MPLSHPVNSARIWIFSTFNLGLIRLNDKFVLIYISSKVVSVIQNIAPSTTIFNVWTISPVGIGIGGKMKREKNYLKNFQKI